MAIEFACEWAWYTGVANVDPEHAIIAIDFESLLVVRQPSPLKV